METGSGAGTHTLAHKHIRTHSEDGHQHPSFKLHFKGHLSHSNKNLSRYNTLSRADRGRESYGMGRRGVRTSRKKMQGKASQTMFVFKSALWIFFMSFSFPASLSEREASSPVWENDLVIAGRCVGFIFLSILSVITSGLLLKLNVWYFPPVLFCWLQYRDLSTAAKCWPHVGNLLPGNRMSDPEVHFATFCYLLIPIYWFTLMCNPSPICYCCLTQPSPKTSVYLQTTTSSKNVTDQTGAACSRRVGGVYLSASRP